MVVHHGCPLYAKLTAVKRSDSMSATGDKARRAYKNIAGRDPARSLQNATTRFFDNFCQQVFLSTACGSATPRSESSIAVGSQLRPVVALPSVKYRGRSQVRNEKYGSSLDLLFLACVPGLLLIFLSAVSYFWDLAGISFFLATCRYSRPRCSRHPASFVLRQPDVGSLHFVVVVCP